MNYKFIVLTSVLLFSFHTMALTFKAGANAGSVSETDLMNALRQGKGSVNGKKIVIKAGANVPTEMKNKWMERQFSGSDAPTEGDASADVIFVESF